MNDVFKAGGGVALDVSDTFSFRQALARGAVNVLDRLCVQRLVRFRACVLLQVSENPVPYAGGNFESFTLPGAGLMYPLALWM